MMRMMLAAGAVLLLSACGTQMGDRMASGAAIGGGAGLALGGIGALPGAAIGAAVGAFTEPDDVNLGDPIWDPKGRNYVGGDEYSGKPDKGEGKPA